ncbi:MAG: hypothetical protein HPY82_08400 [Gammaproteobacteria bacterium]|nr:hypothetical protein [Gammaproteobacteria bacterium]
MYDFPSDKPARPIDTLRTQAEQLGLRIIETGGKYLVSRPGEVIYRTGTVRDLQLFLKMRAEL